MTHGTYYTYQAGCTCEDCTQAAADHALLVKPRPQRNELGQYPVPGLLRLPTVGVLDLHQPPADAPVPPVPEGARSVNCDEWDEEKGPEDEDATCGRCGRNPAAGFAGINGTRYCHGDESGETCYMFASRSPRFLGGWHELF